MGNSMKQIIIGFFVTLVILIAGLAFYWYEYRPTKIRQECSWVSKHQDAKTAIPSKTEEELMQEGSFRDCTVTVDNSFGFHIDKDFCEHRNEMLKKGSPAEPARDWFEKASEKEYDFCIRSKGITR